MARIFLILMCGMLMGFAAQAQDIVILKDGSEVSGLLIVNIVGDHVSIKTDGGQVEQFLAADVEKVIMDHRRHPFELKTKGYFNHTSLNFIIGNSFASSLGLSFYTVNGWQWNKRWMAGLGTGYEWIVYQRFLPIFADLRYNLSSRKASPYIQASAGYGVSLGDGYGEWGDWWNKPYAKNYGGIGGGIQIGYRNYRGKHLGYAFSIGFRYQTNKAVYPDKYSEGQQISFAHTEYMKFAKFQMGFGVVIH